MLDSDYRRLRLWGAWVLHVRIDRSCVRTAIKPLKFREITVYLRLPPLAYGESRCSTTQNLLNLRAIGLAHRTIASPANHGTSCLPQQSAPGAATDYTIWVKLEATLGGFDGCQRFGTKNTISSAFENTERSQPFLERHNR